MKQFFLKNWTSFLSVVKIWEILDRFQASCILFKSWIFVELAENTPTTKWYTRVLGISQQEHLQISWNLEGINYLYEENLLCIYYREEISPYIYIWHLNFQCIIRRWMTVPNCTFKRRVDILKFWKIHMDQWEYIYEEWSTTNTTASFEGGETRLEQDLQGLPTRFVAWNVIVGSVTINGCGCANRWKYSQIYQSVGSSSTPSYGHRSKWYELLLRKGIHRWKPMASRQRRSKGHRNHNLISFRNFT